MFPRKLFLALILSLSFQSSIAAVFSVTSNADTGPGTLREAIINAAANGEFDKDFINFNLPGTSQADRTITLDSALPELSSNLVINGGTQSGAKFGLSDAKIAIICIQGINTGFKIIDKTDVSIFGIYIQYTGTATFPDENDGIQVAGGADIQIGEIGKGNVICGFLYYLTANSHKSTGNVTHNITLKSNFFDVQPDGVTTCSSTSTGFEDIGILNVNGLLTIGGTVSEGNLFVHGASVGYHPNLLGISPTAIAIQNNRFGINYLNQQKGNGLSMFFNSFINITTIIEDNVLAITDYGLYIVGGTILGAGGGELSILRNFIGVNKQGNAISTATGTGLYVGNYSSNVQIGSNNTTDANTIAYCKPLALVTSKKIKVSKNSFFCTRDLYPMYTSSVYVPLPAIELIQSSANSVSGKATPNSLVELFYNDRCKTCSPETYFATVNADANGNWSYTGALAEQVIASATINGSTSEFSNGISVDISAIKRTSVTCKGLGSVTGITAQGTVKYEWRNAAGAVVSNQADLLNQPAGNYTLTVSSSVCSKSILPFTIEQVPPTSFPSYIISIKHVCLGQTNGSIELYGDSKVKSYRWVQVETGTNFYTKKIENIPAGSYQLFLTDVNDCEVDQGEFTLKVVSSPEIVEGTGVVVNDACGQKKGSISGVVIKSETSYTSIWIDEAGNTISPLMDIKDLAAGVYTLKVTESNGCYILTKDFRVNNDNIDVTPPLANNVELCTAGIITIRVSSPQANSSYRLYKNATDTTPIDEQASGLFDVSVTESTSLFVSRLIGTCESARKEVKVAIGLPQFRIANTFTPNGDGINDEWNLPGFENNPQATVQIFNRYGQKVFESTGYGKAFNGTFGGSKLPAATYYYIIRFKGPCKPLSGSVSIIR
ncbi:MAG: gliding motility-associated C-terminal domain-containing protein [Sphingobacteriales bacterium]|nr:MAG: gliding motility-associated C-terminal domain-containing protein [Sphingobacteriales bacterium]